MPMLYALNLGSNAVHVVRTLEKITNPNGGYYFQGKVYVATYPNNKFYSGGVISVDAATFQVEMIKTSYFGVRFDDIDDVTWASRSGSSYMFFTNLDFALLSYTNLLATSYRLRSTGGICRRAS